MSQPVQSRRFVSSALLLVVAAGLAAMCASHAMVVALGPSNGYRHTAQAPAFEAALILAAAALVAIGRHVVDTIRGVRVTRPDWALPALAAIRAQGALRVVCAVVLCQLTALAIGETAEQHAAGVTVGGLAGLAASPLALAPVVHLLVGIAAGLALWLSARAAVAHASALIALVRRAVAWLSRRPTVPVRLSTLPTGAVSAAISLPLAYKIGSRPPPALRVA